MIRNYKVTFVDGKVMPIQATNEIEARYEAKKLCPGNIILRVDLQ